MVYNLLSVSNLSKNKLGSKAQLIVFAYVLIITGKLPIANSTLSPFVFQYVARVDPIACVHTVPCC